MKKNKLLFLTILTFALCFVTTSCQGFFFSNGTSGYSAYEIAVQHGFEGTEKEWLASLTSQVAGLSAYEIAVQHGFVGTETEWLASLQGGARGESAYEIACRNGFKGSEADWLDSLKQKYIEQTDDPQTILEATNLALLSSVKVVCAFGETGVLGSGVLYGGNKAEGTAYIITNQHVMHMDATSGYSDDISIYLYGSKEKIPAEYIGGTATFDIAVLKITNSEVYKNSICLPCTTPLDTNVYVGQTAIAIGNSSGEGISATTGVVNVDSEKITLKTIYNKEQEYRVMRIDSAVNKGNSGGGVFNSKGQLIGIVNAKITSTTIDGVGYALPLYQVLPVVGNIIRNCEGKENKNVLRVLLGVTVQTNQSSAVLLDNGYTKIVEIVTVNKVNADSPLVSILHVDDKMVSFEYEGNLIAIDRLYTLPDYGLNFEEGKEITITFKRMVDNVETTQSRTVTLGTATEID